MWLLFFCLLICNQSSAFFEPIFCESRTLLKTADLAGAKVDSISFNGGDYFSLQKLENIVRHTRKSPLDWLQLLHDASEITRAYRERGFFEAKVIVCLKKQLKAENYTAYFKIEEKNRAYIRHIKIKGNQHISTQELTKHADLNYLNQEDLDGVRKRLLAEYHRRGFLDAEILPTQIQVSPDYREVSLVFAVKEGEAYELDEINLTGDALMLKDLSLKKGDVLNLILLQEEMDALLNPYREQGYVLAELKPQVRMIRQASSTERGIVSVTYHVKKGPLIHVRQFLIEGNSFTAERVIRREIQGRADRVCRLHDLDFLQKKLMALGFFSNVKVLLVKADVLDEVDILIRVVEQPAWFLSVLPMAISDEGFVVSGILAHRNWFGIGLFTSLSLRLSSFSKLFDFVLFEPRAFDSKHSILFEMHQRQLEYSAFHTKSTGVGVHYTIPVGTYFKIRPGMQVDLVNIDQLKDENIARQEAFIPRNNWRNTWEILLAFDYEKSIWKIHGQISGAYSGFLNLSELQFVNMGSAFQISAHIFKNFKINGRFQAGRLLALQQSKLPLCERYFLGGQGSIRGYRPRSIGPELGGVFKYLQSIEVEFPVWPKYSFSGYAFADAGNAFSLNSFDQNPGLHWSLGTGFILNMLQFPLRFEMSIPLSKLGNGLPFDVFVGVSSDW